MEIVGILRGKSVEPIPNQGRREAERRAQREKEREEAATARFSLTFRRVESRERKKEEG